MEAEINNIKDCQNNFLQMNKVVKTMDYDINKLKKGLERLEGQKKNIVNVLDKLSNKDYLTMEDDNNDEINNLNNFQFNKEEEKFEFNNLFEFQTPTYQNNKAIQDKFLNNNSNKYNNNTKSTAKTLTIKGKSIKNF